MNRFPHPESPNFDHNHAFLCSIKAEIITGCLKQQPFSFLLRPSYKYFNGPHCRIESKAPDAPDRGPGGISFIFGAGTQVRLRFNGLIKPGKGTAGAFSSPL